MGARTGGLALSLLLGGCGATLDDGEPGDFVAVEPSAPVVPDAAVPDLGPDAGPDAAPSDGGAGDGTPPDAAVVDLGGYLGTWAHVQIQQGLAILPVLGAEPTTTYGVMHMAAEAGAAPGTLALTFTLCEVRIERERDVVVTEIPQTFIDALPPVDRSATVHDGTFVAERFVELRAVELENPADDPLPTEPDDPRVVDLDDDGQPGLTARVSGLVDGEVYLVQRAITRLEGGLDGQGRLDGLLAWTAEESILAADDPLLVMGAPFEADADPTRSVFRSTRLDEDRDCAWIVENQAALFMR